MFKYSLLVLLIFYLLPALAVSQKIAWPFDDYYGENLVYIHAVANYELNPTWHEKWENNLFRQTMLRLNFASISNTELLSDAHLTLNEELTRGFWFRYATSYYATHHRNEQDNFLPKG